MQHSHFSVEYKTRLRSCVLQFGVAPFTCFPFFTDGRGGVREYQTGFVQDVRAAVCALTQKISSCVRGLC